MRPFHPPRGVLGPFRPKVGNGVENEFPGPSGPGAQKVKNRVEEESKKWKVQLFFNFFDSFSTLFLTFWAPGPEGPGNSFSTPFPTLGPKGPRTPLGGWKGRNATVVIVSVVGSFGQEGLKWQFLPRRTFSDKKLLHCNCQGIFP